MNTTELAEQPFYVYLGEYEAAENELSLQVGVNTEKTEDVTYKVTLGDEELAVTENLSYEEAGLSASYIYLVDVSGSIRSTDMEEMKEMLLSLVDGLGKEDNACILLVGDSAYAGSFISDKEALKEQINAIETLKEDTNLYYAMNQAMDILATSANANARKCLLVLSDGEDDQITGITEQEVADKIAEVNIPVCTVAMYRDGKSDENISKVIGSFARMSPGGMHMTYGVDTMSAEEVAANVMSVTKDIRVLKADISGVETEGSESYLQVEAADSAIGTAKDGYDVTNVSIQQGIIAVETEEPEVATESSTEIPTEIPVKEDSKGGYFWIVAVVAVVLIAAAAGILIHSKKKKAALARKAETQEGESDCVRKQDNKVQDMPEPGLSAAENADGAIAVKDADRTNRPDDTDGRADVKPKTLAVTLTRVGLVEEEVRHIEIPGGLFVGRDEARCGLCFHGDEQLSAVHCQFLYDGDNLYLRDMGSTNGTFVNGVPIRDIPHELEKDDKISIGSMEWRIYW